MRPPHQPSRPQPLATRASATAPGTCGELAQGMLEDALVMVTCPIDLFATATVEISVGEGLVRGPADSPKSTKAVGLALEHLNRLDVNARLHLQSPIPRQKGMAASTADVLSSIVATATALGVALSVSRQAELALAVEPSDGTMFPGVALFDHRRGRIARSLGNPPPMRVLVLEFDEEVNTEDFNSVDRRAAWESQSEPFGKALGMIKLGLKKGDEQLIGQGATLNAIAYQQIFPNRRLEAGLSLGGATGAVGVNVAHSGSAVGLLFADNPSQVEWAAHQARERLPDLTAAHPHRLIGGGVMLIPPKRAAKALGTSDHGQVLHQY